MELSMRLKMSAILAASAWSAAALAAPVVAAVAAPAVTVFAEAEAGAPPFVARIKGAPPPAASAECWTAREMEGASGGKVLYFSARYFVPECPGLVLQVPQSGTYRIWVRYFKKAPLSLGAYALVRDEAGEEQGSFFLDWVQFIPTETPYLEPAALNGGTTNFVWESFDVAFDRPMEARLSFGGLNPRARKNERQVDCALLTTDRTLDPRRIDLAALPGLATTPPTPPAAQTPAPEGYIRSAGLPTRPETFAGIDDPDRRFWAGLINCGSIFIDGARMLRMGFNRDHTAGAWAWGIPAMTPVETFNDPAFLKGNPAPTGRFVNAKGEVGSMFSLHYPPWNAAAEAGLKKRVQEVLADDSGVVGFWRISAEEGGWIDYSPWAQAAFRRWLADKHGTIATLNTRWGTAYGTFDEIVPPATVGDGRACWLEFREFSGHAYAESVGRRIPVIQALDPKRRPCLGANSNLDIGAPYFMVFRPNDFEELIRVGLKDERYVAFDIYCADDDMGSSIDFLSSIAQGRKLINQEFSNHVVDPRIAARTYWMQIGKGVHGIHLFMFQDSPGHATYPKWGLLSRDGSPKQKLAAYSDAAQEVHHLEPLLMSATPTHAVKPVAIYWSRIDLSLEPPHESWYGHGLNSPIHVYETFRSLGYPVRWITPRQITEGELDQTAALVMAGCNHVPQAAAERIVSWVDGGGTVIADSFPGAFDEYGQPQTALASLFGVRPAPKKTAGSGTQMALLESRQGYGEVTDAAALREKHYEKIDEIAQQPGATHPVALALGDFMLTGVNLETVICDTGKVVGMTHRGHPGLVVNEPGKGRALYSAFLLGTIYEAAPTRYEWDTAHSGGSYARVLDAFLAYAGARPGSRVTGLAPRVAAKLRIESPLITPSGDVLVALTSMNDDEVKPFDLAVELPPRSGPFVRVLVATQGSRKLQPVEARLDGATLRLQMPPFDTHATILALKDSAPLVSLELTGVERGPAALAMIRPGQTFDVEAVVYNPSPRKLAAGRLAFTAPAGWLQSAPDAAIDEIKPGGEARCSFRVRAPETAGRCRINPLLARYANAKIRSTPATEMVWWGLPPAAGN
jgi:hypothetical protein